MSTTFEKVFDADMAREYLANPASLNLHDFNRFQMCEDFGPQHYEALKGSLQDRLAIVSRTIATLSLSGMPRCQMLYLLCSILNKIQLKDFPAIQELWIDSDALQHIELTDPFAPNTVHLHNAPLRDLGFLWPHASALQKLALVRCKQLSVAFAGTKALPCLQDLSLDNCRQTIFGDCSMPALTSLTITSSDMQDEDFRLLAQCGSLQKVRLENLPNITSAAIGFLSGTNELLELELHCCPKVDDGILAFAAGQKSLNKLVIGASGYVGYPYPQYRSAAISDAGMELLSGHPALATLVLNWTSLTSKGLSVLPTLPQLRELNVGSSKVTDTGVAKFVSQCQSLHRFVWGGSGVTEKAIAVLKKTHKQIDTEKGNYKKPA